ncbi:nuclear transport factor 2 family protein [Marivita hallyeonensis]|uniref:Putative lumazine-binding n=1 Tax=Marivita hallyeonensis TaxID=996342 RepID=A0A1M5RJ27_9RHOB|nr:nuclear transport factor 2 family protein [Marivita hallyeonensis]SHH26146.1 Putative lumazine-binding [Marivita hallyeonensis]
MDGSSVDSKRAFDEVFAQAVAYSEAVYYARADVFKGMCHERFSMTLINDDGTTLHWDKASYLERVSGRTAFEGNASYEIKGIDVSGGTMARVHLWVDVPSARYEDHLGFVLVDGSWKLLTKVFRTAVRLDAAE